MNQDDFKIRKTNAKESLIVARILSCKSTDDIHALALQALPDFLLHEPSPEAIKRIIEVFYKQLESLRFDEFKDRELADWKRVRAAIEHENTLVNHRLTWLLTSQGFLFAGFGVVYSSKKDSPLDLHGIAILIVVAVVGMAISFKIFIDTEDAARQLSDLDCWWHRTYAPEEYNPENNKDEFSRRRAAKKRLERLHPDLQRRREHKMFWLDKGLKVEITFLFAWLAILSCVIGKPLVRLLIEANHDYSDVWYGMPVFLAIVFIIGWWIMYHRAGYS